MSEEVKKEEQIIGNEPDEAQEEKRLHEEPDELKDDVTKKEPGRGKRKMKPKYLALSIFFFLVAICSGGYLISYQIGLARQQKIYESLQDKNEEDLPIIIIEPEELKRPEETGQAEETVEPALPSDENMLREIHFQTLQSETNPDIYAWVFIPETNIDYPILQHATSDSYYLDYNLDGSKGYPGCIYTERLNQKDFSDFNTLIYGHNMKNGSMFHDLHLYEEESFFKEHPYVYIYLPGRALKYEIFAAYAYDDRHILYSFDFGDEEVRKSYLEAITGDPGVKGQVNREIRVGEDSHVVTLSTCIGGKSSNRFLVQAVLVEE